MSAAQELHQYIGQMLNQLADLADQEPDGELSAVAFDMRLLSDRVDPYQRRRGHEDRSPQRSTRSDADFLPH